MTWLICIKTHFWEEKNISLRYFSLQKVWVTIYLLIGTKQTRQLRIFKKSIKIFWSILTSKTFSQLSHHLSLKNQILFSWTHFMLVNFTSKYNRRFDYFNYHWDKLGTFKLLLFLFSIYLQNFAPPTGIIGWPELLNAITIIRQNCDISSSSDTKTQKHLLI